ncbi:ATP-binding protein [Polymorphospora sp. NPDC051019]|uniref:ATP-binding protein n=1 Tax=Polymorphospora sp. NPDC051019 TaxID=3155725 RepID=UPI0034424368
MRPQDVVGWLQGALTGTRPVLCLTGLAGLGKRQLLREAASQLGHHIRPAEVDLVWLDDPGTDERALTLLAPFGEAVAAAGTQPPPAPRRSTLLLTADLDTLRDRNPSLADLVARAVRSVTDVHRHRLALVVGMAQRPAEPFQGRVEQVGFIQPRTAALDHVTAWARHDSGQDVLLVTGRPGAGKSTLARTVLHRLADETGVTVAYATVWDQVGQAGGPAVRESELVHAVADVIGRDAPEALLAHGATFIKLTQQVGSGTAIGVNKPVIATPTLGFLYGVLEARARIARERGDEPDTLVLVVDAMDDQRRDAESLRVLTELLTRYADFARWGLRLLLFSQYPPVGFPPDGPYPRRLDLADSADADIGEYVLTALTDPALAVRLRAERMDAVAAAVVRRCAGQFLVAAGYLAEIRAAGQVPADLWRSEPIGSLVDYYHGALPRLLGRDLGPGAWPERVLRDSERALFIAATTRHGLTETEMSRVWTVADEPGRGRPGSQTWRGARENVLRGPVREYLVLPDPAAGAGPAGRVMLFHPAAAAAVRAMAASDGEWTGADLERRRFVRALTPLFPEGVEWDARTGRLALAETPARLAEIIDAAAELGHDDEDLALWQGRLALLVESWEWLEACLLAPAPTAGDIPLGLDAAIAGLAVTQRLLDSGRLAPGLLSARSVPVLPRPSRVIASAPPPPPVEESAETPAPGQRRYAVLGQGEIVAFLTGELRYTSRAEAVASLQRLREVYPIARREDDDSDSVRLWVKWFGLTIQDWEAGFVGHYVDLEPEPVGAGQWRIGVHKHRVDRIDRHPERRSPGQAHPNWGHRVLRRALGSPRPQQRPQIFATRAEAESQLDTLREDYPLSTAWRAGRLGVLVYEGWRRERSEKPTHQYSLRIEATVGGYVVRAVDEDFDPEGGPDEL